MNESMIEVLAAVAMVGVAAAMFFGFRRYLAVNSERRMRAMLESVGLDPEISTSGEIPTIMKEVRQRCRSCASESVCERWLQGKKDDSNDFCPNAKVFDVLRKHSHSA
jgi:hypothetical protein